MAEQDIRVVDKVAVEHSRGKDAWDILSIIASILIPLVVIFVGHLLSEQQKKANEIAKQADRLSVLIKHLASNNPRERKIAVDISSFLADNGQLPTELIPTIIDLADTGENSAEAKKAANLLAKIGEKAPQLKKQIQQSAVDIPARVYFHITQESQRTPAKALASRLITQLVAIDLKVPGVQRVSGPENTQFRFFKAEEKEEAQRIVASLRTLDIRVVLVDLSSRYQNSKNIRPRHYELWLGKNFK